MTWEVYKWQKIVISKKKLDELIFVGKAVYTMLKKDAEQKEAAYTRMEDTLKEILANQEKAVKIMVKCNRDERQSMVEAINEEVVKVQSVIADSRKQLMGTVEELDNSIKHISISVAAAPVVTTAVDSMADLPTGEMIDDIMSLLEPEEDYEAEVEAPDLELEIPEPEPAPTPAPVSGDSNRAMTPDEIAALIASMK